MKTSFILSFLGLMISIHGFSQLLFDNCGTIAPSGDPFNALPDSIKFAEKSNELQVASIKIFTYIIDASNCTGYWAVKPGEVELAIEKMEEQFNNISPNHMICFYSIGSDFICSDDYYNFSDDAEDDDFNDLINLYSHIDAITIFFLPKNSAGPGGRASGIPGRSLVIHGDLISSAYGVLSHEMGHCLGLFHTFQGAWCDNIVPSPTLCWESCQELVNGSNCIVCGDYVCDTPADFENSQLSGSTTFGPCVYDGIGATAVDYNGDSYNPDISNIMSYGSPFCLNHFTPGQGERMFSFIKGDYSLSVKVVPADVSLPMVTLTDSYIPLITNYGVGGVAATNNTVVATNTITAGGQATPYIQSPQFGGVDNVTFIAGKSIRLMQRFRAGGTFRASVESNSCTPVSKRMGNFQSEQGSTTYAQHQMEISSGQRMQRISPNPSINGVFSILGHSASCNKLITVYNPLGEILLKIKSAEFDISNFPKGIYFVKITNGENISVQKIIYQ